MTHQRAYQKQMYKQNFCVICGQFRVTRMHCEKHRQMHNRNQRIYRERKKHDKSAIPSISIHEIIRATHGGLPEHSTPAGTNLA